MPFFKKLSVIDLLVVFTIVFALGVGLVHFSREKSVVYIHTVTTTQDWIQTLPTFYWISNSIKKGDTVFTSGGQQVAEVVDIDNVDFGGEHRYARLKLKANVLFDKGTKQYRMVDTTLRVGEKMTLDIGNTKYEGMITYVGTVLDPPEFLYQERELKIKSAEVEPWLAETYDESFIVKNTQNKEIFRIINSRIQPAEKSVKTASGSIVKAYDPILKDVYITARARVRCQEGVCYFNEVVPLKVGNPFWVQSANSVIESKNTRIIEIEEHED